MPAVHPCKGTASMSCFYPSAQHKHTWQPLDGALVQKSHPHRRVVGLCQACMQVVQFKQVGALHGAHICGQAGRVAGLQARHSGWAASKRARQAAMRAHECSPWPPWLPRASSDRPTSSLRGQLWPTAPARSPAPAAQREGSRRGRGSVQLQVLWNPQHERGFQLQLHSKRAGLDW